VVEHFNTIAEMLEAEPEEWMKIDGIGEKTAEKVVKELGQ